MGANQSRYAQSRRKSALRVLETIKPRIATGEKSQLNLLNYVYAYISLASSSTKYSACLNYLERKLHKYISSAIKSPLANGRPAFFHRQFDIDQTLLATQLGHANVCVQDMELFEQILTAARRKDVLPFGEFIVERPPGQIGRVQSMHLQMKNELEFSVLHGPAGGYASTKSPEQAPWWETREKNGEGAQMTRRQTTSHGKVRNNTSSICSAPDILRIRNDTTPKPLFHSATVRERSGSSALPPSRFSFTSDSTAIHRPRSSDSAPNSRVHSIASTVLSSRDWHENENKNPPTTTPSQSQPENKILSPTTARDLTYRNPRDSWTSSIYSEASFTTEDTLTPENVASNAVNYSPEAAYASSITLPPQISPTMTATSSQISNHDESSRNSSVDSGSTALSSAPSLGPPLNNSNNNDDKFASIATNLSLSDTTNHLSKPNQHVVAADKSVVDTTTTASTETHNLSNTSSPRTSPDNVHKRFSDPGFGALFRVKYDFERAMDGGVKISLCKEDLAEVRINKRGSYVKVEAWVPLGEIEGHIDFEGGRRIRDAK